MLVDIHHVNLPVSDALQEFTERRLTRVLRPFRTKIARVDVRISDLNGPRGGVDKRCGMTVELTETKHTVVVEGKSADVYEAVDTVCARLRNAVSRTLTRRRWLRRFGSAPRETLASRFPGSSVEGAQGVAEARLMITATDQQRLRSLTHTWSSARDRGAVDALADELDRAEVVPVERIAGEVVAMNSRVVLEDEDNGEIRELLLVYPTRADPEYGQISVLSPMGSALLGLSVGQTLDWPLPRGRTSRLRIVRIVYQPEEAGHLHL